MAMQKRPPKVQTKIVMPADLRSEYEQLAYTGDVSLANVLRLGLEAGLPSARAAILAISEVREAATT